MAFEDTFTRADADTLGSPWTHLDGQSLGSKFGVRSGEARFLGPLDSAPVWSLGQYYSTQFATVDVGSTDMAVEWNVTAPSAGGSLYLPFRYALGTSPRWTDNTLGLYATSANVTQLILATPTTTLDTINASGWRTGDTIRVEAVGTSISVYRNGTLIGGGVSSECLGNTRAGFGGNATSDRPMYARTTGTGNKWTVVDAGTDIQTVEWEWSALNKPATYHLFRFKDASNLWILQQVSTNSFELWQFNAGVWVLRAAATTTGPSPGDVLRVEAGASAIVVKVNGTTIITYSTPAPGSAFSKAGLAGGSAATATKWTRFKLNSFETTFDVDAGALPAPWTTIAGTWTVAATNAWTGTPRTSNLDFYHWTRFWCSPWPLARGYRNIGMVRGARG